MALTDLFKLHDPSLMEKYQEKPYKADKDRAAFKKSLDAVLEQVDKKRTKVPNRMWSIANDVVLFEPKFKGKPVPMMGETVFTFHKEHFAEAIAVIKASVDAGELDDVFEGSEGTSSVAKATAPKQTRSSPADRLTGIRRAVGSRLSKGQKLDDIEEVLTSNSKYEPEDVKAVIAEYRASAK